MTTVLNGQTGVSKTITIPEAEETARTGSAGTDDLLVATRTTRMDVYTASYTADGSQEYVTRTDTEYGEHGEVTKVNDYGAFSETADDNTTSDDICTTTGYLKDSAKHFVVPITTKTVSVRCAITETTPDQLIGASEISYDDPGDRGLPTSVKTNDKDGALNNASPTVHTVYDDRGRVESSTDPLGRVSETRYAESYGVPATVTTKSPDPDGTGDGDGDGVTLTAHESTTTLHPLLGVPTKVSDPNGHLTTATYDAAGRLLSVTYPDRQGKSANVTYAYSTSRTGVNAVTTKTLAADGVKYHVSVALYDGLLRPIQTQTESLDGDEEAVNGRLITDTEYDGNGRVWFTTSGWLATGKPSTTLVGAAVEPDATTVFTYDGLGRVRTEALFTGTISNAAYERWRTTTHYDGATTTVIPPDGATPTQTKVDARGRTVALSQFLRDPVKDLSVRTLAGVLDLDEQTTKYEYDKAGRLSKVFDPDSNKWEYQYDKLGRQVVAIDPDAGKTETEYDAAGQVTWVMNGANQKLHYTYDQLGRRKTVRQDTAGTGALRAKWTYDVLTSYAGTNPPSAKGQVTSSTRVAPSADGSGEFVTALTGFDAAYRPTRTVTVIPDTNTKMAGLSGTYEQKVTYTADGQVASTTYPAAGGLSKETVTTHFDDETSVAEWMGGGFGWGTYVASSRTDVFGRLSYLDLGNTYGTVVSYGYEVGTSRLMNVKLDRERIGGTELDIRYAYDDAGNVLSAKDKPTTAGRAADQQCYQYDALRHLTEAWTPATGNCALAKSTAALGGSAPYWASFQYDDVLGNRTDETYRTRGLAGDVDGGVTTQRGYDYEGSRDLNADGDSTDAGEFAGSHAVTSITTSVDKHYTLPFGEQRGGVSAPGDHEFLGKVRDGATGLTLVGARWYDETVGRFLTVDPVMDLADPQQWNAYTYANNNPTTWWDPDGLEPRPWHQDGVSFSHPKSKAYLRSEGSNSDGWNTGWGTGTYSGPMTISTGIPDVVDGSEWNWGDDAVDLHSDYKGPQHTLAYDLLLAGLYSPGSEQALTNASWVSPLAEAANLGLDLACKQKGCSAYEDSSNGDAALSAATLFIPGPNVASHGDEVADATKTADEIPWGAACSFAGATPVLMADGSRKQIKNIEVGDEVIATDPEGGEEAARKVTHVWVHQDDLFEFEVDGELIVTTEDHPFWSVTDQAWEGAQELDAGEEVLGADGSALTVTRVLDLGSIKSDAAYNLTVSGLHTYHVGVQDVLVHNAGGGGPFDGFDWDSVLGDWDAEDVDDDGYHAPRGNQAENKQFNDAIKEIEHGLGQKVTPDQRRQLHDRITGKGYDYHRIVREGRQIFGCG
ncbi:RHS repeat-associated core domain-containing protein [Promicromonospora sp. NPDC050249]|uniref:RHS repeat-associated core domain-containing protein n=1 Tax=Promicromonospora sp. NPDC050249 TaxID=3154743 RepID=UPI0033E7A652